MRIEDELCMGPDERTWDDCQDDDPTACVICGNPFATFNEERDEWLCDNCRRRLQHALDEQYARLSVAWAIRMKDALENEQGVSVAELTTLQQEWEQGFNLAHEGETWLSFKKRRLEAK